MAERETKPVSQRRSKLVENLLAQQLAQSGQPAYSPLEVAGRLAMVYALNKDVGKNTAAEQAQMQGMLESIAEMTRPTAGFGPDTPMLPSRPDSTDVPTPTPEAMEQVLAPHRQHSQLMQLLAGIAPNNPEMVQGLAGSLLGEELFGARSRQRERAAKQEDMVFKSDLDRQRQLDVDAARRENAPPDITNIYDENRGARAAFIKDGMLYERNPDGSMGRPVQGDTLVLGKAPLSAANPQDLGISKLQLDRLNETEIATATALSQSARLREIVASGAYTGIVGFAVRAGEAIGQQAQQISRIVQESFIDGKRVSNEALLDPALYDDWLRNSPFADAAAQSQAFKTTIVGLMYSTAAAQKGGGRLNNQDVERAGEMLAQMGIAQGSPTQLISALNEMDAMMVNSYAFRYRQATGRPLPPNHFEQMGLYRQAPTMNPRPERSPTVPGRTPEDQALLDKYR